MIVFIRTRLIFFNILHQLKDRRVKVNYVNLSAYNRMVVLLFLPIPSLFFCLLLFPMPLSSTAC